ncbi:DUF4242 domain-containing protein [Collibacillus ludicampi]|uniref:DUF4242 domain-containing protein n=1 Tax=Collibacillus ludicampi TaxID=2771369 RepID=A0AAV4LKV6_9BACL|nr:DUF4242 domain-containing protein [Collibacillus ludicampi]GIM47982.1 DUF4242 domain-containing protein [Collibacillus ludicampi]
MALYLIESVLPEELRECDIFKKSVESIDHFLKEEEGSLLEVQVSKDLTRAFFVFEISDPNKIREILGKENIPVTLVKQVRLVGQELEKVRVNTDKVRYVVEWNLPEGLTMDAYLKRKKEKSVHYAEVPEATFIRTYVCEDMTKCLCFYDAPDKEIVKKARNAVQAPVDSITEVLPIDQVKK